MDGLEAAPAPDDILKGRNVLPQFLALSVLGGEVEIGRVGGGIVVFLQGHAPGLFEGGQLLFEQRLANIVHSGVIMMMLLLLAKW